MSLQRVIFTLLSSLIIISCATAEPKKKEPEKKHNPAVLKGDILEMYDEEGNLVASGKVSLPDKKKNGKWVLYQKGTKNSAMEGEFSDDKKDGSWTGFYEKGAKKSESLYKKGLMEGKVNTYYESGKLQSEAGYVNNNLSGKKSVFVESGEKISEFEYLNNKKNGEGKEYHPNGVPKKEDLYREDKKNGNSKEYFPNGKLKTNSFYKDDVLEGNSNEYHASGNQKAYGSYAGGKRVGTWSFYHDNGKPAMTGKFSAEGKMEGKWQTFFPEGSIESEGEYKSNTQDGLWSFYNKNKIVEKKLTMKGPMVGGRCEFYENGRLTGEYEMSGLLKNPKKNGPAKEYYPSGKVKAEGKYMADRRADAWIFYNEDGSKDEANSGNYMMGKKMK